MVEVWSIAFFRAGGLLVGLMLLYPPLAWFERWCNLAPGEREKIGRHIMLPIATVFKLISKRASIPGHADRPLHIVAPFFALFPSLFVLALIPPGPPVISANGPVHLAVAGDLGTLPAVIALFLISPIGILLASKAGGVHFGLVTGIRMTLVRTSGTMILFLVGFIVAKSSQSLYLTEIIHGQGKELWGPIPALGLLKNPIAFVCAVLVIAFVGQRTQISRPGDPGDLLEPYTISASGPILLAHRVFEVLETLSLAAFLTVLFFGGWLIPGVDQPHLHLPEDTSSAILRVVLFQGKTLVVAFGIMYLRRLLPKLHYDQILRVFWFVLFPVLFLGFLLTSALGMFLS